jgi:hypothetical protein
MAAILFAAEDLQLGIELRSQPEPALHILLTNAGQEHRDLQAGVEGSEGLIYSFVIVARDPHGREFPVFDRNALRTVSQPPDAILLHLSPGEVRDFIYPLSQLLGVVNGQEVPMATLLKRGYTMRASFQSGGTTIVSPISRKAAE